MEVFKYLDSMQKEDGLYNLYLDYNYKNFKSIFLISLSSFYYFINF